MKLTRAIFILVPCLILVAGISFGIYNAFMENSAWVAVVIITLVITGASVVYGFGEIVLSFKKKNESSQKDLNVKWE